AGVNGANRLCGTSLSDLLVSGRCSGEFSAKFAKKNSLGKIDDGRFENVASEALAPFERRDAENPYQVQKDLQDTMQDLVGIVRNESEMREALEKIDGLKKRAERAAASGNREYNPGWHTALDLKNLLTDSEAIARAAQERKASRGAQFRDDYPDK